jgi:hypothetical protein
MPAGDCECLGGGGKSLNLLDIFAGAALHY